MSCGIRREKVLAEFDELLVEVTEWLEKEGFNETREHITRYVWSLFNHTDYAVANDNVLPPMYPVIPANICLVVQILLLDALVIGYYQKQRTRFVPMMYMIISSCDMIMGLGHLLEYLFLHLLCVDVIGDISFWWSTTISMSILSLANYLSIFSNMILALCRTINTVFPFYKIKPKLVIVGIAAFLLACVGLLLYDHVRTFEKYYPWVHSISFIIMYPILGLTLKDSWLIFLVLGIPLLIPSAIVIICFTIQTRFILCQTAAVTSQMGAVTAKNNRHVTITVLLLTALFIMCHTTFTVVVSLSWLMEDEGMMRMLNGTPGVFICTTLPLINAAFSPVIIICRCAGLRQGLRKMVVGCWSRHCLPSKERGTSRGQRNSVITMQSQVETVLL